MPKESLLAVAVSNRGAIEKSLALLHSKIIAANNPEAKRELLGHTIYLINMGRFFPSFSPDEKTPLAGQGPVEARRPQLPTFAFTVTDSHFIFGSEATVEQAIRTLRSPGGGGVDSAKWFVKAKSTIPSVLGLAGFEDNVASMELLWWLMKENAKSRNPNMMSSNPQMMVARGAMDLFNFELLPQFETVKKYFSLSSFYGLSRPDGFFFEFNYLSPATTE
jgi:hypothetical protein